MTDEELAKALSEIETGDIEIAHGRADDLLVEFLRKLGYSKSIEAYEAIPKWYA